MVTPLQIKTLGLKISSMDGEDLGTDDGFDAMMIITWSLVMEEHRAR